MQTQKKQSLILPIAMFCVAAFFYLYEFLLRVSPNVLEKELFQAFGMDARAFGVFTSCYYWSYAALQLPVGAWTDKYGPRRLLTFAVLLCAGSTYLLAMTESFFLSCVCRFLIGAGSAFAFISCLKIINIWFDAKWFPFLTGMTLAIGTLGAAVGGQPLSLALHFYDWRSLLNIISGVGLVLGILSWLLVKDKNPIKKEQHSSNKRPKFFRCLLDVIKHPQNWLVGLYAFFVTAPTDAFGGAWGVKFLTDVHGISRNDASTAAVTMTFIGMAIGSPLLGWMSGRLNSRKWPMLLSSISAAIFLTLIIYLPTLNGLGASLLFFCFGASATYVLAFVMIRRLTASIYVATAVGFVNMMSMIGSSLLTYIIGWFLDVMRAGAVSELGIPLYSINAFHISLVVLPVFYTVSAFLVVPFIRDNKD
tara:strand:- start:131024 stop:132283 length:1260 start_codon:yes stop_codon:yes gene_type:complete